MAEEEIRIFLNPKGDRAIVTSPSGNIFEGEETRTVHYSVDHLGVRKSLGEFEERMEYAEALQAETGLPIVVIDFKDNQPQVQ
jgi:hypothetical protein